MPSVAVPTHAPAPCCLALLLRIHLCCLSNSFLCSKECQAADWPEHRPVCRPLAEYRNKMRAAMEAAKQALLPAASSSGTRGHKPTAAKPAPRS